MPSNRTVRDTTCQPSFVSCSMAERAQGRREGGEEAHCVREAEKRRGEERERRGGKEGGTEGGEGIGGGGGGGGGEGDALLGVCQRLKEAIAC